MGAGSNFSGLAIFQDCPGGSYNDYNVGTVYGDLEPVYRAKEEQ